MKKFLVLYRAPIAVLDEWMAKPAEERKEEEAKMMAEWDAWTKKNASALKQTAGAGKNQTVTAAGTASTRNDIMMFSLVEAESEEAVAKMFEGHPHFQISQASIDIMPANFLPGME